MTEKLNPLRLSIVLAALAFSFAVSQANAANAKTYPGSMGVRNAGANPSSGILLGEIENTALFERLPPNNDPSSLPGANFVSSEDIATLNVEDDDFTGLFFVDTDVIPSNFATRLDAEGYQLLTDGTLLDKKGEPVAMFVSADTSVVPTEPADEIVQSPDDALAFADINFPLATCFQTTYIHIKRFRWWKGWQYKARTEADAWYAPLIDGVGYCHIYLMPAPMNFLSTYVWNGIGTSPNEDHCFLCSSESVTDKTSWSYLAVIKFPSLHHGIYVYDTGSIAHIYVFPW